MANQQSPKALNIALWIVQFIVGILLIMPGLMKLFQPIESLSAMLPWTGQIPSSLVRLLGLFDLLGGLGLILPSLLRIRPKLTVAAAYGCILLMVSAIIFHLSRGEGAVIGFNILLIALLAFIAWGRTKKVPVVAR